LIKFSARLFHFLSSLIYDHSSLSRAIHGQFDLFIGFRQPGVAQSILFCADDKRKRAAHIHMGIKAFSMRGGCHCAYFKLATPGDCLHRCTFKDRHGKERAYAAMHNIRVPEIGAWIAR